VLADAVVRTGFAAHSWLNARANAFGPEATAEAGFLAAPMTVQVHGDATHGAVCECEPGALALTIAPSGLIAPAQAGRGVGLVPGFPGFARFLHRFFMLPEHDRSTWARC
jgi:hypothetical protein